MAETKPLLKSALGRWDLVLLKVVAIVNINNVPPVAVYGWTSLVLWVAAFLTFFVPEAVAVLVFSRRFPGEGGIYLWTRKQFGEAHGFLSGWCYWTNNLFYIPVLLVYMAGIFAFAAGTRSADLVNARWFVAGVAFLWLGIIAVTNIRGLGAGKWIQNAGGVSAGLGIALVLAAAAAALSSGAAERVPALAGAGWEMATSFAVMCNAFVGVELASTMADEIKDANRDLPFAVYVAGAVSLAAYVLVTAAVLTLVPFGQVGVIQGVMQAVGVGARQAHISWIVAPLALVLGLSIGGTASAWFAGSSRVPFVAGLSNALPEALGRVHPRWHSPHVALTTCAVLAGLFTCWSLIGSGVAEAYQVLLKSAVVIQLIPFIYLFLGLSTLTDVGVFVRAAGAVGLIATLVGIVAAFVPTADVSHLAAFETKMTVGVIVPTAIGWMLFVKSRRGRSAEVSRYT
jgi:amino acid transporter